jgi:hypothetical protein
MSSWTFDVKFSLGTQFTFGSLTFAAGENGDLKMLPPRPAPECPTLVSSFTLGGACSGLDPVVGLYIHTAKLIRGVPVVMSILRPLTGASSSSSSALSPSQHSFDDYAEIRVSACEIPQKTTTSSLWWPQTGIGPATAPVDIPL